MAEKRRAGEFYSELIDRLEALPEVASAGAVNRLPLTGNWWVESFAIEGRMPANPQDMHTANGRTILPGYFESMGVPQLQGRALAETDNEDALPAVVINQTTARRYWADQNPIGQRLTLDSGRRGNPHWFTVVGVVGDERHIQLELEPRPMLYFTIAQAMSGFGSDWAMDVIVKTKSNPLALVGAVRSQVLAMNRNLPVLNVNSMEQIVASSSIPRRHPGDSPSNLALMKPGDDSVPMPGLPNPKSVHPHQCAKSGSGGKPAAFSPWHSGQAGTAFGWRAAGLVFPPVTQLPSDHPEKERHNANTLARLALRRANAAQT